MAEEKVESEVATQLDLSVIRYSRVVEDHRVLSRALQIEADKDVVMCITRYIIKIMIIECCVHISSPSPSIQFW